MINMETEYICKYIPIELWEIIAQESSSSVRCIIRCLNKDLKVMIETKFKKNDYKLIPQELFHEESQSMFNWCIKYALSDDQTFKRIRSIWFYHILIQEDALDYIKQVYELAPIKFTGYNEISSKRFKGRNEIIKFFVEKKCPDNEMIIYLCEDAAEDGNLDILKYLNEIYKLEINFLNSCAYKAAYNGHYTTLEYLLEKGCRESLICIYAAKGGQYKCLKLSYKYKCIKDDYDLNRVESYLFDYCFFKFHDKNKLESCNKCYQFMKKIKLGNLNFFI